MCIRICAKTYRHIQIHTHVHTQVQRLENVINDREQIISLMQSRVEDLTLTHSEMSLRLETVLRNAQMDDATRSEAAHAQLLESHKRVHALIRDVDDARARIYELESALREAHNLITSISAEKERELNLRSEVERALDDTKDDLKHMQEEFDQSQKMVKSVRARLQAAESEFSAAVGGFEANMRKVETLFTGM
jgi:chromosome segregation ATPase